MFIFLIIFLLHSCSLVCSESDNQQEKKFTFERKTYFISDSAIITSVLLLKNNYTGDECSEDRQYILNKNQNVINIQQFGGKGSTSTFRSRSSEAERNRFINLFPGVALLFLRNNKKPNFSVSFNLDEIPEEELINSDNFLQNYGEEHLVEFMKEYVASVRSEQNESIFWRFLKSIQQCSIQ